MSDAGRRTERLVALALDTGRLALHPWQRDDLHRMAEWPPFADPLDQEWNWPQRLRAEGSLDLLWISHAADPSRHAWTIRIGGAVAGLLQLRQIRAVEGSAGMGIALGAPWVGQGWGSTALQAFLPSYFDACGFSALWLEVGLANRRAVRLYQRLRFRETKQFWREAETSLDYGFLDEDAYTAVRPYFRWANGGVYQRCAEMELAAGQGLGAGGWGLGR